MKSKDWKNLWFYVIFTSGSTICCCTSINVAKATNPNSLTKKAELVSKISYLVDSRFISQSSHRYFSNSDRALAGDKRKTKKVTSLMVQPQTINNNKFKIKTQVLGQKKESILLHSLKPVPDSIVSQSRQDTHSTDQNITCLGCWDFFVHDRELAIEPIQIAQNEEQSPPATERLDMEKDPPPLESQPTEFRAPSTEEIEQKLDSLEDERSKRLESLLQRLEENKQKQEESFNRELGTIVAEEVPIPPQPPELQQPPSIEKPIVKFKPVGYLLGRVGYFHTSNIFSSRTDAIDDGLIFSGLTLAAAPLKIGPKTYLNGSIDGNIIRYSEQSEFDYNQIRFNLGVYQQLTNRMYGEIGWNNQQLFYSKDGDRFNFESGDKFLNENSFRFSIGRRDPLARKLNLDSFYELRLSLTNPPEKRNRIINYIWLSLNYSLQKSLRFGIDYQFNLSNFLERSREDQYHRLSGNLKYSISQLSSISLQSGFTNGGSTDRNIDFDGWFFSVNYSWDLGQF